MGIVFPCGTGTASWNSTTDAQKRPTSPGEWYRLALKPSYYFSQMFGAVCLPDWNGTGCNSTIRNNWSESRYVPPLTPTIWMPPMRLMRLPSLIKRHCQSSSHIHITFISFYYIIIIIIYSCPLFPPLLNWIFSRLYLSIDPINRLIYRTLYLAFITLMRQIALIGYKNSQFRYIRYVNGYGCVIRRR